MEKEQNAAAAAAAAVAAVNTQGSLGLGGIWQAVGNASAMLVVLCCFCWQLWRSEQHAMDDRALCREQLKEMRSSFDAMLFEMRRK